MKVSSFIFISSSQRTVSNFKVKKKFTKLQVQIRSTEDITWQEMSNGD